MGGCLCVVLLAKCSYNYTQLITSGLLDVPFGHISPSQVFFPPAFFSIHRGRHDVQSSPLLSPERAALGKTGLATGGLAQNLGAAGADDDGLCVREDGGNGEAARALDVHEERAWAWDKSLQLVLAGLSLRGWVQKIDCENHICGVVAGFIVCRIGMMRPCGELSVRDGLMS